MLYDLTSLCRQSLEALPLPRASIPLMLTAWETHQKITALIAPDKAKWDAAQLLTHNPRRFGRSHWPKRLEVDATPLLCLFYWCCARACFGDNGYKQTLDRGFYSCNFQCRVDTYKEFTSHVICDMCDISLPQLFFNSGGTCEGCRMEKAIYREIDHLEEEIRDTTRALGYGETDEPYVSNKDSNFPYEAFAKAEQDGLVKTRQDMFDFLYEFPQLQEFWRCAEKLDDEEAKAKFFRGRFCGRQKDNEYMTPPFPYTSQQQILGCYAYRRTLTHEEFEQTEGKGWAPAQGVQHCPW